MDIKIPRHIKKLIHTLQAAGFQAVLAGGCVRDALLGKCPHDHDIASSASPDQVEALFPQTYAVGKEFGIIVVHTPLEDVEVAMFRSDGEYEDGRHPGKVLPATMEDDTRRRDFTINAMLYDPLAHKLYDFNGGQKDLQRQIVRAVGDPSLRFHEDKLRMLRAIRFAAQLDFSLEECTQTAIENQADTISVVSQERIAAELGKMLLSGHSEYAFRKLQQTGILKYILPEVASLVGVEQPPQFHPEGDVWNHTMLLLRGFDQNYRMNRNAHQDSRRFFRGKLHNATNSEWLALAWAALLHDIGKPATQTFSDRIRFNGHDVVSAEMTEKIGRRLKMSNELIAKICKLVRSHMMMISYQNMRISKRRMFLQEPDTPLLIELCRLDRMASLGECLLKDIKQAINDWQDEDAKPKLTKPLLNGDDLLALGLQPGPQFRTLLERVKEATLEGKVSTKEEALEYVNSILKF